ncbi:MAG: hypothetical protein V1772_01165, partial [Chloroflexota bacterium]
PAESWFLSDDSALNTLAGVTLALTGCLPVYLQQHRRVDGQFMSAFLQRSPSSFAVRHFGPFFQWSSAGVPVEVGFLPLPKVWSAFVVWLFGTPYAAWAVPFLGVLAVMLMVALVRRLSGWRVAAPAALALAISFPQMWFARYPISEIHAQVVLLGALYLLALYRQADTHQDAARRLLLLGALCLGLFTVLRFEGLLYVLPVALVIVVSGAAGWPRLGDGRRWLLALAGAVGLGLALSLAVARFYIFDQALGVATPRVTRYLLALLYAGALLGVAGWWLARRHPAGALTVARLGAEWLPRLVAGLWLLWAAVALYLVLGRDRATTVPGWLSLYWSRPGLALSLVGIVAALWPWSRRRPAPELLALLGVAAFFACLFTAFPLVNDVQPWAMRRLVPAVMPALAYGLGLAWGVALDSLRRWTTSCPVARIVGIGGVALALLAQLALIGSRTAPFLLYRDAEGLWAQLAALDAALPRDAIVLFDNGSIGQRLPQVMELVFERPSLSLPRLITTARLDQLDLMLADTQAAGRPAYLIVTDGDLRWRSATHTLSYESQRLLVTPGLAPLTKRNPLASDITMRTMPLDIYAIVPREAALRGPATAPLVVPLGPEGYPYLAEGFWWGDALGNGKFTRWTKGDALVTLPWPAHAPSDAADFCLSFTLATGRPANSEPPVLTLMAEGVHLLDVPLGLGFDPQQICARAEGLANRSDPDLELRLSTDTWSPQAAGFSEDSRELGVLISEIVVQPGRTCPAGCALP